MTWLDDDKRDVMGTWAGVVEVVRAHIREDFLGIFKLGMEEPEACD